MRNSSGPGQWSMSDTWRTAFFRQAQSDYFMALDLRRSGAPACHWLHFLQMSAEKLAKGYACSRMGGQPRTTHAGFTRFLQFVALKDERLRVQWRTKNPRRASYQEMVCSLTHVGLLIEHLAPSLADRGPNPEYPWEQGIHVLAPIDYSFPEIIIQWGPQLENLFRFLDTCFRTLN